MPHSHNIDARSQQILDEVLKELQNNDDALESHLPPEVTKLDKAALLAVLYRVLMKCS